MSGVPMSADAGHAFSGGALSERGAKEAHPPEAWTAGCAPRSESVTHYEAAPALGGTGLYRVLELPRTVEVDGVFPSLEAAQSHALALNEWLAARPDPAVLHPFFESSWLASDEVARAWTEPTYEGLVGIFERMLRPETP